MIPLSENGRGIAFMCISMLAFTLNDAAMKAATETLPLFQAIFLRGLVSTLGLALLAIATTGRLRLFPPAADRVPVALRTLGEIASTAFFLIALVHMPLANLSAIMQSLPLAVTLGAAVFLGEPVGWRRLLAIGAGFVGVLVIIRPGADTFDVWSLLGLASVLGVVLRDLSTRRFGSAMPSVVPAIWAAAAVTVMGGVAMPIQGMIRPGLHDLALTTGAAACLILGYMMAIKAMRIGDLGLVAPFRYTSLLWAILLGWLVFRNLPDTVTLIGAAIVVASGLYMLARERKVRMSADARPPRVAQGGPSV
jgi:drug/metabolite transporter (DMT)-like permease